MNLDDLTRSTGEWLKGEGLMSDVVISSRIRLARNLAERPFLNTASESDQTEIYRCLANEVTAADDDAMFIDLDEVDAIDRELLVERNLISCQHAAARGSRGVSVSPGETRSLMINEEDHLRIQGLRSGFQLDAIWEEVDRADDAVAASLPMAFDSQFGYLTACPTNVGTGIRVSVMLHLPALRLTKEIERVARAARDMHLAVRGVHGEGTEAVGDLYQLSNQTTLGKTEREIIDSFSTAIIPRIVEYERAARDTLARKQPVRLDDKIWRAYGLLSNARRLSTGETHTLLSPLRMGIFMGRFTKFDVKRWNELFLFTQPAHLQKLHGVSMGERERAIARSDYLRDRLEN